MACPYILIPNKPPDYGNVSRSGKMVVLREILQTWRTSGRRVLLFSQTQQCLNILEDFVLSENYPYLRMDGSTPVDQRMSLIDSFNSPSSPTFIFLLTTKVGGLGINLTGASRVLLYDPDWNPSTDVQARERAWRLGQVKDVAVYRLIMAGTIEEKIYQRQVFKQFLSDKILKNPKQKRLFRAYDMRNLFTLSSDNTTTETGEIFGNEFIPEERRDKRAKEKDDEGGIKGKEENGTIDKEDSIPGSSTPEEPDQKEEVGLMGTLKGVAGYKEYEPEQDRPEGQNGGEYDLLHDLCDMAGVQSVLEHDTLMEGQGSDESLLAEEAKAIAEQAIATLKRSRAIGSGRISSLASRFGKTRGRGRAIGSASILSPIQGGRDGGEASGPGKNDSGHRAMLLDLCAYLARQPGQAAETKQIVDHFEEEMRRMEVALFRKLLKEVAVFERDPSDGIRKWKLRPKFRL